MANWAFATINVEGTKENINNFITDCFNWAYDEIKIKNKDKKYFANSFIEESYFNFNKRFHNELETIENNEETSFEITAMFRWSATGCIMPYGLYVRMCQDTCIDLPTACKLYNVDVEIWTEEDGECFEEHIYCDSNGDILIDETEEIKQYVCKNCENEQHFGSLEEEFLCYECDKSGIENWTLEE